MIAHVYRTLDINGRLQAVTPIEPRLQLNIVAGALFAIETQPGAWCQVTRRWRYGYICASSLALGSTGLFRGCKNASGIASSLDDTTHLRRTDRALRTISKIEHAPLPGEIPRCF